MPARVWLIVCLWTQTALVISQLPNQTVYRQHLSTQQLLDSIQSHKKVTGVSTTTPLVSDDATRLRQLLAQAVDIYLLERRAALLATSRASTSQLPIRQILEKYGSATSLALVPVSFFGKTPLVPVPTIVPKSDVASQIRYE